MAFVLGEKDIHWSIVMPLKAFIGAVFSTWTARTTVMQHKKG